MSDEPRREKGMRAFDPHTMGVFSNERGFWYESPADAAEAEAWGKEVRRLIRWIRATMGRRLTAREQAALVEYYFEGRSFREAGGELGRNASSVHRAVRRALVKLRRAAEEEGVTMRTPRRGRRQSR